MIVVKTKILPPGAGAFTFWPFIFIHPDLASNPDTLTHELVHLEQQKRWAPVGLVTGPLGIIAAVCLGAP